jgi:transcriptional regulator with XRE-family HTH domain
MSKNLSELIAEIQFRLDLTLEQIAERIGYARQHLAVSMKENAKGKILATVLKEFADVITPEGHTGEKIAAQEAAIRVILDELITLRNLVTKEPTEQIALHLADKIKRLLILP